MVEFSGAVWEGDGSACYPLPLRGGIDRKSLRLDTQLGDQLAVGRGEFVDVFGQIGDGVVAAFRHGESETDQAVVELLGVEGRGELLVELSQHRFRRTLGGEHDNTALVGEIDQARCA